MFASMHRLDAMHLSMFSPIPPSTERVGMQLGFEPAGSQIPLPGDDLKIKKPPFILMDGNEEIWHLANTDDWSIPQPSGKTQV